MSPNLLQQSCRSIESSSSFGKEEQEEESELKSLASAEEDGDASICSDTLHASDLKSVVVQVGNSSSDMKKSVTFQPSVFVHLIPDLSEYSDIQMRQMWFDSVDYQMMKKDILDTVDRMRNGETELDNKKNCFRGLEWKVKGASARRKQRRHLAYIAVFDEQDRQYYKGEREDPEKIAKVYSKHTPSCSAEAFRRAMQDELEATSILHESIAPSSFAATRGRNNLQLRLPRHSSRSPPTAVCWP